MSSFTRFFGKLVKIHLFRVMVSVLFTRERSIYKQLGADCWDIKRNALMVPKNRVYIAHPPCRAWGDFYAVAKPREGERELAIWAVDMIREYGGVLEHPVTSRLWKEKNLPQPGRTDEFGGFTICIDQHWFGHRAIKKTFLYIVGCKMKDLPEIPYNLDAIQTTVERMCRAERERTPDKLARWLLQVGDIIQVVISEGITQKRKNNKMCHY